MIRDHRRAVDVKAGRWLAVYALMYWVALAVDIPFYGIPYVGFAIKSAALLGAILCTIGALLLLSPDGARVQ